MSNRNETSLAAARVYSLSMLELAESEHVADSLLEELLGLQSLLDGSPELRRLFESPLIDADDRKELVERTFRGRASDLLVDSLQVLNQHGRIGLVGTVVETYRTSHQARHGRVDVHVTSAVALTDGQREALIASLRTIDDRTPDLIEHVEPGLLGGMVVRIGDRKIDTSVAKDLRMVRDQLKDRAAREILADRVA